MGGACSLGTNQAVRIEHSLPPLELGRPWRTTALVASAVALLELLAIVSLGIGLLGEPVAERVRAQAEGPAFPKPAKPAPVQRPRETHLPTLARADTSILVLLRSFCRLATGAA